MAEGKKIEVTMVAAGGDQAAAEIRKPEEATSDLAEATSDLGKRTDELASKNAKALQGREEMLRGILEMSRMMKEYGERMKEAGPEIDAIFGKENAQKVQAFGEGLEALGSAAALGATGFAAGGPLGGAIGALVGVLLPTAKKMLEDMFDSMKNAATAEAALAAAQEAHNQKMAIGIDVYNDLRDAARNYKEETQDLNDQLEEQEDLLESIRKITNAKAATAAAQRDAEDAAKIRAGAVPEDVKAARAKFDAEEQKKKIQGEVDDAKSADDAAGVALDKARRNLIAVNNNPKVRDPKEVTAAEDALRDAEKAAKKARTDYETTTEVAEQKTTQVDLRRDTKVADLAAARDKRLADEQRRASEKAADQAREKADAAAREADARGDLETEASGIGVQAGRAAGNLGAQSGFTQRLERLGAAISRKGDSKGDESNLRQMMAMIETMMGLIEKRGPDAMNDKDAQKLREMDKKLKTLEARISRARDGR